MGTGYTRNDTGNNIADGNVIDAADLDGEFDAVQAAFNASTGHSHDGTTGEGPQIDTAGLADGAVTTAKLDADSVTKAKIGDNEVGTEHLDETDSYTMAGLSLTGNLSTTADITFGDNDKAIFGAGSDLQIYHNGAASVISDVGTGNFFIGGDNDVFISKADLSEVKAKFSTNGAVTLYYDNAPKLATTSTGIDVTGTVTADGLTVENSTSEVIIEGTNTSTFSLVAGISLKSNNYRKSGLTIYDELDNEDFFIGRPYASVNQFVITNDGADRMRINSGGDISFYEDTGTTPKFFWDASAERLGIGTSSPLTNLHVDMPSDGTAGAILRYLGGTNNPGMYFSVNESTRVCQIDATGSTSGILAFATSGAERMRIDSSGNVVIGASSTNGTGKLQVTDAVNYTFEVKSGGSGIVTLGGTSGTNNMAFQTNGSERMRIDSSGNLLVGQTSTYSPSGGGTSKAVFTNNVDAQHTVVISNQTNGSSASASLVLGSYGADWVISNGSSAKNTCALTFARSGTERMRIDSSGNVGIGTSSPEGKLRLSGDGTYAGGGLVVDNGAQRGYVYQVGANLRFEVGSSSYKMTWGQAGATEDMTLDSSGNLLVGGTLYSGEGTSISHPDNSGNFSIFSGSGTGYQWRFGNVSNGVVGSITTSTSATAYNTSSDYRLKTDVQPMTGATERLKALNPVNFEWISSGERVDGFLAHEAQEVVPEAVTGTKDAMRTEEYEVTPAVLDDDGNVVTEAVMGTREVPDYQGIDQSKLVPLLVATVQEQQAVIESLTARIEALEN